jgi:hypothetical protein
MHTIYIPKQQNSAKNLKKEKKENKKLLKQHRKINQISLIKPRVIEGEKKIASLVNLSLK